MTHYIQIDPGYTIDGDRPDLFYGFAVLRCNQRAAENHTPHNDAHYRALCHCYDVARAEMGAPPCPPPTRYTVSYGELARSGTIYDWAMSDLSELAEMLHDGWEANQIPHCPIEEPHHEAYMRAMLHLIDGLERGADILTEYHEDIFGYHNEPRDMMA